MINSLEKTNSFKYRLLLQKFYFDKGYGLLSYAKWFIAFMGIAGLSLNNVIILATVFIPMCYVIGRLFVKKGWAHMETEVSNRVNPFVEEMRKVYK